MSILLSDHLLYTWRHISPFLIIIRYVNTSFDRTEESSVGSDDCACCRLDRLRSLFSSSLEWDKYPVAFRSLTVQTKFRLTL